MVKSDRKTKLRNYNAKILLGCGTVMFFFFFIAAFLLLTILNNDRDQALYPGATSVSSHSNYSGLPYEYRWDDSYLVRDNFTTVYQWYSTTFNLGAEARANGDCIQLDGQTSQLRVKRTVNVLLCTTPAGQRVYVTRITAVNR
ncbi:MAG: hypothetical protein DWQ04_25480 [Chloroflexi bacterium]|nr:MAG: hypothetical protein DWQ04_25480 [Chloroflexota bacterium]